MRACARAKPHPLNVSRFAGKARVVAVSDLNEELRGHLERLLAERYFMVCFIVHCVLLYFVLYFVQMERQMALGCLWSLPGR